MGTTNEDSQNLGQQVSRSVAEEIERRDAVVTKRLYIVLAIFAVVSLVVGFAIVMNMRFPVR